MRFFRQALILPAVLGAGIFLGADPPHPKGIPVHDFAKWKESIRKELDGKLAGGYAFVVMHDGKIVASGAEGWARAPWEKTDPGVRWTTTKPMPLASVSKTITAVGILKLWDETKHKFSLDEPFWPYLKKLVPKADEGVKKITIRQLLMHTSGLSKPKNEDVLTIPQLQKLLSLPLAHPPGETAAYDNNNFFIVGKVLEEISKTPYTTYVNEHVFYPIDIKDMETHYQHEQPTCGYGEKGDKSPGYPYAWDQSKSPGAAGWYGSAESLCKFLAALRAHKILSKEAEKEFFGNSLGWDNSTPFMKGGDFGYDDGKSHGETHSSIVYFPDYVEAVLLINCKFSRGPGDVLVDAWNASREKAEK